MSYVAGDITEVTYSHPTLGNGSFFPKAATDSTFDLGGFESADDEEGIAGDGQMIDKMNRKRWSCELEIAWDMNTQADLTKAKQLQASPVQTTFTITHINGAVWKGTGKPVGKLEGNGNNGTFKMKISGGKDLVKISG